MTPATEPSPELEAITDRIVRAMLSGQGETVANVLSANDPLLFCGSAWGEIWEGQLLRDSYAAHVNEFPDNRILDTSVRAYQTGTTGWALWTARSIPSTSGKEIEIKLSIVYVLEQGIWRIQMIHNAVSISNLEVLGYEHSAISELLDALNQNPNPIGLSGDVSLLFTDVVGSTELAEALGDARWAGIAQAHLADVRRVVETHEGSVVKFLGDGTLSSFPSARSAFLAAIALQQHMAAAQDEPRLSIRAGIHSGSVVDAEGDIFGTVVNKAARVAESAGAGEVRVSDISRILVGSDSRFRFSDRAKITLKGLQGSHLVYLLDWQE